MKTRCVMCNAGFEGYGSRGVCTRCQAKYPVFVPKEQLSQENYALGNLGYRFRANGAVRYDHSDAAVQHGDAPAKGHRALHDPWADVPRIQKRTMQDRLDSFHKRLAQTFLTGELPDSMIGEVQRAQIASGKAPMSSDQLRQLAGYMLGQSDPTAAGVTNRIASPVIKGASNG